MVVNQRLDHKIGGHNFLQHRIHAIKSCEIINFLEGAIYLMELGLLVPIRQLLTTGRLKYSFNCNFWQETTPQLEEGCKFNTNSTQLVQ